MPGLHASSRTVVIQHDSASDFLAAAYPTLRRHEASSNIVLAHALKRVSAEAALSGYQFICDADVEAFLATAEPSSFIPHRNGDSLWLTLWNMAPSSPPTLDLVLSCVNWTLGEYPIFLWTPRRPSSLSSEWLMPRINQLAEHLQSCVPPERVFSVFGTTPLVKAFARCWTDMTGFTVEPEPFYAAYFSYCTLETFKDCDALLPEGHALRRATMRDLECVAGLCKEFADDSVFFPLSLERARIEARELITKGQIWVYDASGDITTICAVTRNSQRVSAITKVYTTPRWRRRRCAEFLVRDVTARLLFECAKDCVVLYVGHDNSAQRVYDRVGFAGLCGKDKPEGVEDSLELGFVGTNRGHW
ncbi:hypothetical protein AcW1_001100 [Taiwanofungus camphoratus]|nr:hypothetical protein AcW2_000387 [Antrodia cinnamomea]KAI0937021.1 hypothetical protein AcV5_005017 [Antrodia cinnamomea]KAI0962243.1 hypothetical protein AcV7_001124 [Antrodia cinnamomea]KAI0964237.1 hypothetical protein AcW1_001100 [Antrodia cinnamomea]